MIPSPIVRPGRGVLSPPRMSSGFVSAAAVGRVFRRGGAIVWSISFRNRDAATTGFMVAFDTDRDPVAGDATASRGGDRHVMRLGAEKVGTMTFPHGWRIQRGLYVAASSAETTLTAPFLAAYFNVEYDLVRPSDDKVDTDPTDEG